MPESVLRFDIRLFAYMNGRWHTAWLDMLMPLVRNPYFWTPLYFFLLVFMILNFRWKGWWWVLFFLAAFGIGDHLAASVVKPWIHRLRPCNDPVVAPYVRMLVRCGSGFSFPSNHAVNHFAMATFMYVTMRKAFARWIGIVFLWAFIVAYAQVYVGVHYPVDITGGALLGILIGLVLAWIYNRKIGLQPEI